MVGLALVVVPGLDDAGGAPKGGEITEFFRGEPRRILLRIPPLVYHGFKTVSTEEALLINIPTEPYRLAKPDEFRVHPHDNDIPYSWDRKDG